MNSGSIGGFKGRNPSVKLSDAEMQEKVRKGECFRCEEKYSPTHVCKNKQFEVIILAEEEEEEELEQNEGETAVGGQLSIHSIVGLTTKIFEGVGRTWWEKSSGIGGLKKT